MNWDFIRECFRFTRHEQPGMYALIVILLVTISLPWFFGRNKTEVSDEEFETYKKEIDVFLAEIKKSAEKPDSLFTFDPNTIDSVALTRLGFSPKQARTILNYRRKGGKFHTKENFGKSFAVSEQMYARLFPYIDIRRGDTRAEAPARKDVSLAEIKKTVEKPDSLFTFDPNTVDSVSLTRLGFSPKQARTFLNYRRGGGKFHTKEDFGKSFVVSEQMYDKLSPYIDIQGRDARAEAPARKDERKRDFAKPETATERKTLTELNAADTSELQKLRGIGSYYARRIVEYRNRLGGFLHPEQLMEIRGIDSARFALFRDWISLDTALIDGIDLNNADERALGRHPYIGFHLARSILKYKSFRKTIASTDELVENKILTAQQAEKISPYLKFK